MTQTGNQFDVAINGRGYLQVQLPSGETAYTRAGNLSVNENGQMVTADGYTVLPQITIPANATGVTISKSGQVQASIPGQTAPQTVGQMQLATFFNEAGWTPRAATCSSSPAPRARRWSATPAPSATAPCSKATPRRPTSIR